MQRNYDVHDHQSDRRNPAPKRRGSPMPVAEVVGVLLIPLGQPISLVVEAGGRTGRVTKTENVNPPTKYAGREERVGRT